jgi:hypothetical protein
MRVSKKKFEDEITWVMRCLPHWSGVFPAAEAVGYSYSRLRAPGRGESKEVCDNGGRVIAKCWTRKPARRRRYCIGPIGQL